MSKSFVKRKEKSFYIKEKSKNFLKRSVKEKNLKVTMLVNPPTLISCIVLNASWMRICMKQMEREEKLPHGDGSGGGLIGPSVAT